MATWLSFALLGLGLGAVYAAIAGGVVVVYRGTGIINFATSAIAVWGVFVCDELRRTGDLVFPVFVIPDRVGLVDGGAPTWLAVVLGVLSVAVIAALVNHVIVRRLATAPALARVVVSLGLMITFLGLAPLKFGTVIRVPQPILPTERVEIAGVGVPMDRPLLALIVTAVGLAIWAWFRWSYTGLAVVAAAENEQAAAYAGFSPNRLGAITWVLGLASTTLVLILASPSMNLDATVYTLMIAPALAVALLGRLQSVPIAVGAGLTLGALQSTLTHAKSQEWFPSWGRQGINDAIPFLLVVVVLFLLGRALPERGAARSDPLPPVFIPNVTRARVATLFAAGLASVVLTSGGYRFGVITSMIAVLISSSLVLLTGMVGQISVAQAAFAGSAGFVLAKMGDDLPFPFSLLLAGLVAAALGVAVGIPALRIRGAQLAVVTLAAAVAIEQLVFRNPEISPAGGNVITPATLFGLDLSVRDGRNTATLTFGVLVLVIVGIGVLGVANLMRSATGRRFLAVRANERAGASLGVDVSGVKVVAFAVSSFLAGIGGALIGLSREQLSPESFGLFIGLSMLSFAYLGGITSLTGAFLAGTFAPLGIGYVVSGRLITPHVAEFKEYYALLGGVGMVLNAVLNPVGIAGAIHEKRAKKAEKKAAKRSSRLAERNVVSAPDDAPAVTTAAHPTALEEAVAAPVPPRRGDGVPSLRIEGVSVSYGGLDAVRDVSLEVAPGQILGLIGPNGAGKTTLIDAVTGYVACTGNIVLGDVELTSLAPHRRAHAGVVRTWQSGELFEELTVLQNVLVGADRRGLVRSTVHDLVRPTQGPHPDEVAWALWLMGLSDVADRHPSELPLGRQKLLSVARALAMAPSVLLLDEPAAGLDTTESLRFGERLRAVRDAGVAVLLVDHDMGLVLDVCDEVCVMAFGEVLAHGRPDQVRVDPAVVHAYLGEPAVAS